MNAERLLKALSGLGDEAEQVKRLRKLVIALVVCGQIDARPSLPIGDTTTKHVRKTRSKGQPHTIELTPDDLPEGFSDPSNFVRLGSVALIEKGKTGIKQAKPGTYPLVVTAAERATSEQYDFEGAAAIVPLVSSTGHGNATINRLHYQDGKFALGSILAAIFPHDPGLISARFIYEYLSAFKDEVLLPRMTGTANVTLTIGRLAEVPIPIVSPSNQEFVDELMALCDRLEAARTEREKARDRFAAAGLARLRAPDADPATFADHARFAIENLAALTTRPDQIKALRQTILDLAVRGKLVPQDPTDEPAASELRAVERSKAKKALRKQKKITQIDYKEEWWPIPKGWIWARWDQLTDWITYGFTRPIEHAGDGVPIVTGKNVTEGQIIFETASLTSRKLFDSLSEKDKPQPGDILITKDGSIGRTAIVNETHLPFCINQSVAVMWLRSCHFDRRFLQLVLDSPQTQEILLEKTAGVAIKHISITDLGKMLIPLPPLAEQHRIVAKVDALMALCDRLEASLTAAADTRRRLLDALTAEALTPTSTGEWEVAT